MLKYQYNTILLVVVWDHVSPELRRVLRRSVSKNSRGCAFLRCPINYGPYFSNSEEFLSFYYGLFKFRLNHVSTLLFLGRCNIYLQFGRWKKTLNLTEFYWIQYFIGSFHFVPITYNLAPSYVNCVRTSWTTKHVYFELNQEQSFSNKIREYILLFLGTKNCLLRI